MTFRAVAALRSGTPIKIFLTYLVNKIFPYWAENEKANFYLPYSILNPDTS